jgi:hypothetical protein
MKAGSWDIDTEVRVRGWNERTDEDQVVDLEIAESIPDRLEAILQLRDVQDLTDVPRMDTR